MRQRNKDLFNRMLGNVITNDEARELGKEFHLNPFYIINPSSNKIHMSLMKNVFWKTFSKYSTLPENWYAILKNEIKS